MGKVRAGKAPAFQFYAADYLADENVALMTLEEEGAYTRALAYCWREGSIPADPEKLSRLLKGASAEVVATVVRRFDKMMTPIGERFIHARLELEREKQREWIKKSADAGKMSGKARRTKKLHAEPKVNQPSHLVDEKTNQNANLVEPNANSSSSSSSSSSNQEQKQKPSRRQAAREPKHSTDPRHIACKELIFAAYRHKNKGADPPWDGREGKALGMLLGADPGMTPETMRPILQHWARSELNHADRPSIWIPKLSSFRLAPIDRFNKPMGDGNAKGNSTYGPKSKTAGNFSELQAALAIVGDEAVSVVSDSPPSDGITGYLPALRE